MATFDRRLLVAAICVISAALAAALLLGQPNGTLATVSHDLHREYWPYIRHSLSRKNFATTIQAVGALVTFWGLAGAYTRSKDNQTVGQWLQAKAKKARDKVLRRTPPARPHTGSAHATITIRATASGHIIHNVDITQSLHEQIKRLAAFVNNRSRDAAKTTNRVSKIERKLNRIRDESSQLEARMWTQIESQIQDLNDRLDRVKVLDLSWAIRGLLISAIGTLWSFGT